MSGSTWTQSKPRRKSSWHKRATYLSGGAIAAWALLVPFALAPQYASLRHDCQPLTFPAGTEDEVVEQAADFLTRVESIREHPYWPGGTSGITLGIGWDIGYHTRAELLSVWADLGSDALGRLASAAGKKGGAAQALLPHLKSVQVSTDISRRVLVSSLRGYYYPFVNQTFPGIEQLPAEAQVVVISLVFNRGVSMGHEPDWRFAKEVDRRWEFRELRQDVKQGDLFAIYIHLGTMKRLWEVSGPRGLRIRRRDEQALIRPYVDKQLQWDNRCGG
jgi:hypothetical protein